MELAKILGLGSGDDAENLQTLLFIFFCLLEFWLGLLLLDVEIGLYLMEGPEVGPEVGPEAGSDRLNFDYTTIKGQTFIALHRSSVPCLIVLYWHLIFFHRLVISCCHRAVELPGLISPAE